MSTYDALTRAEIQEFHKAKVLNEKIGKITPQTAGSLQALLKKNPTTFKTDVGEKLARAAGEIKETGSCNCIYCGAGQAAEGKVFCAQHQNINFARMAEMKKQEESAAANAVGDNFPQNGAGNNLQQNLAGNSPQQNVAGNCSQQNAAGNSLRQNAAGAAVPQPGQDGKKKLIKYALIVAAFFLVVSFIGGKKSSGFKGDDLANYMGKSFEDLQKDYPYVQKGIIDITGLDNVSICMQDDKICNITIEPGSSFSLAGIRVGNTMESAKKILKKRCKGKIDDSAPDAYVAEMKINGRLCSVWARGSNGSVRDVIVMYVT